MTRQQLAKKLAKEAGEYLLKSFYKFQPEEKGYKANRTLVTKYDKGAEKIILEAIKKYFPDDAKVCYDLARKLQVITTRNGILTWKTPDGDVVAQNEGESNMLLFIREDDRVAHLAESCVKMGDSEKNTKKKDPVKVPQGIKKLALDYSPEPEPEPKPKKSKKSKNIKLDLDLDDLDD